MPGRRLRSNLPRGDKSGRTDGTWPRADVEWDPENDRYICPEGHEIKQFRRNCSDPDRGPTGKGTARYRARKEACQACPSKPRCCPNADARKITREEHEDARDVARAIAKTDAYVTSMRLRKTVEMLFAHLQRILGLGRLRLRGPCSASDEFLLTAPNLRKLAKTFPLPPEPATRSAGGQISPHHQRLAEPTDGSFLQNWPAVDVRGLWITSSLPAHSRPSIRCADAAGAAPIAAITCSCSTSEALELKSSARITLPTGWLS